MSTIAVGMAALTRLWAAAPSWPVVFGICTILYLIVNRFRIYWRLRAFRGPFWANFSEVWILQRTLAGNMHEKSQEVIEKYGGPEAIARVGPNLLMTSDTALIKRINDERSWKKGSWYPPMALDPGHDSVFSTTDDAVHDRLKSQLTRGVCV